MKLIERISLLAAAIALSMGLASAQQNTLVQTSLTTAITNSAQTFPVASVTGITATPATMLLVDKEIMTVNSVSGLQVTVARGQNGSKAFGHISGAMVLSGQPSWFNSYSPSGSCVTATTVATPWVNVNNGTQFLCSPVTLQWAVGFMNADTPSQPTAAVASVAGFITPSGPLFHVTGALAITGFNIPVGFGWGSFTIIPDGTFTTTNANNIAVASTAIVSKAMTFSYDQVTKLFYPSY